jgi:hypothetical protein
MEAGCVVSPGARGFVRALRLLADAVELPAHLSWFRQATSYWETLAVFLEFWGWLPA